MSPSQRFLKREHLRHREDFARVYAKRYSAGDAALVVFVVRNRLPWSRLGISASRRIGNAVCRARVRRRIREAFRRNKDDLPTGLDIVCVAKRRAADADIDLERSLRVLVTRAAETSNQPDHRTRSVPDTALTRSDPDCRDRGL